jgi:hypothetical protein
MQMSSRKHWQIGAAAVAAVAVGVGGGLAVQDGFASTQADSPHAATAVPCKQLGGYFFGPNLVRADIALFVQGSAHLFRVDRGRVKSVSIDSITVRERDGTQVMIPVAPGATVRVNGRLSTLAGLRKRHVVLTIRDGDSPASCVLATSGR